VERSEAFIAKEGLGDSVQVELETRTLEEVDEALEILGSGVAPHVSRCARGGPLSAPCRVVRAADAVPSPPSRAAAPSAPRCAASSHAPARPHTPSFPPRVMLDNMSKRDPSKPGGVDVSMLRAAVARVRDFNAAAAAAGRAPVETEASGNVTLESVAAFAGTGVDFVSVGALTHSVVALDISLNIVTQQQAEAGAALAAAAAAGKQQHAQRQHATAAR
jgi:hypothetical protein